MIICLHGYLSCKESFLKQILFLSRFYRVVAVDMTGFGESRKMETPFSVDDYKREIKNVMSELEVKECYLLAHSFGARVAIKLAADDDRIKKIIFTGAAGLKPKRGVKYLFKKASFLMLKKLVPKEKLEFCYSSDYRALPPVMRESFKSVVNEYLEDEARKIKAKTLILSGKRDRAVLPEAQKRLNKLIKNSKLKFINGGHFCFADNAELFNSIVFDFLTEG